MPGEIPDDSVIAYVVLKQDHWAGTSELRGAVKAQLPDHMVPSTFMVLDSLPRTPNGKVDRRALPLPDQHRPDLKDVFVAPRTPAEQSLAGIWAHLLRVERVGIHDNFFDLGGHSLLAMQFIARMRDAFEVELPLRALFDNPTIEGIAFELMKIQAGGMSGSELSRMMANLESLSNEEVEAAIKSIRWSVAAAGGR